MESDVRIIEVESIDPILPYAPRMIVITTLEALELIPTSMKDGFLVQFTDPDGNKSEVRRYRQMGKLQ